MAINVHHGQVIDGHPGFNCSPSNLQRAPLASHRLTSRLWLIIVGRPLQTFRAAFAVAQIVDPRA